MSNVLSSHGPPPARIAYVDHAAQVGGAEKSLLDLIRRLDRSRFEPILFCSEEAEWVSELCRSNVALERVFASGGVLLRTRETVGAGWPKRTRSIVEAAGPVLRLWRRFSALKPQLIHTNTLKTHLLGAAAARLARRPVLWHLRDILDPGPALELLQAAARRFRPRVIAISEAVRRSLRGVEVETTVIHNGTDLSTFRLLPDREELRSRLGLAAEHIAITIVGRLTPWKGHRELLAAFAEVAREEPKARLLVVGEVAFWDSEYEFELRNLGEKLGVAGLVHWLGFRTNVPQILAASDIFALPSVNEPFGRAVVEAMAVELPVVATRSGGVPEIVVEGETGLLVNPGAKDELAAALLRLARDPGLRRSMGKAGRARAVKLFDADRTAERIQEVYEDMLRETSAPTAASATPEG